MLGTAKTTCYSGGTDLQINYDLQKQQKKENQSWFVFQTFVSKWILCFYLCYIVFFFRHFGMDTHLIPRTKNRHLCMHIASFLELLNSLWQLGVGTWGVDYLSTTCKYHLYVQCKLRAQKVIALPTSLQSVCIHLLCTCCNDCLSNPEYLQKLAMTKYY